MPTPPAARRTIRSARETNRRERAASSGVWVAPPQSRASDSSSGVWTGLKWRLRSAPRRKPRLAVASSPDASSVSGATSGRGSGGTAAGGAAPTKRDGPRKGVALISISGGGSIGSMVRMMGLGSKGAPVTRRFGRILAGRISAGTGGATGAPLGSGGSARLVGSTVRW